MIPNPFPKFLDREEAAEIAMDLHYPEWDTLGREESDLPERILPYGPYQLVELPTSLIPEESPCSTDQKTIDEHIQALEADPAHQMNPIIAPFSETDEPIADGWHRALAYKAAGRETIPAYVPVKLTEKLCKNL